MNRRGSHYFFCLLGAVCLALLTLTGCSNHDDNNDDFPQEFIILASASNNGTISPAGEVAVKKNEEMAFHITPNGGHHIADVRVDSVSMGAVAAYTFDHVDSNCTIEAVFAIDTYTIDATAGANGSIMPNGVTPVNFGALQVFAISPNDGYHTADVRMDGVSVGAVAAYTFDQVNSNHTIEAVFAIDTYTIDATAGANGSIVPNGVATVNHGGQQVLAITPNSGFRVADVQVDGISVGPATSYTFSNVSQDHTIEASFELAQEIPGNGIDDDADGNIDEETIDLDGLDTAGLQDLIDHAAAGSVFELTADNPFIVDQTLVITTDNITLFAPPGSVSLLGSGTPPDLVNLIRIEASDVTLDGLEVANGSGDLIKQDSHRSDISLRNMVVRDSTGDECIQLKKCTDCLMEDIWVYNCAQDGLNFYDGVNVAIKNAVVGCDPAEDWCEYGSNSINANVWLDSNNGVTVDNLTIFSSSYGGSGTGGYGFLLSNNSGPATVSNLYIHDNDVKLGGYLLGIVGHASEDHISLDNVTVEENVGIALDLREDTVTNSTISFSNATFENNHGGLIDVLNYDPTDCIMTNSSGKENNGQTLFPPDPITDGGGNNFEP